MKCPNCGATTPEGAVECAGCGVIFAKLKQKLEREKGQEKEPDKEEAPAPAQFNPWKGRLIAMALVLAWFIAFGLYYRGLVSEMPVLHPEGPERTR